MRKLTTLLLTIFTLACTAQEPHECYSVDFFDSVTNNYEQRIINLQSIINTFDNNSAVADTFSFQIRGLTDSTITTINKQGANVLVNIIDGFKRVNADYINGRRSAVIMDSTYSVGTLNIR